MPGVMHAACAFAQDLPGARQGLIPAALKRLKAGVR
jgi:hypothetical protein